MGRMMKTMVCCIAGFALLANLAAVGSAADLDLEYNEHPLGRGTPGFALLGGGSMTRVAGGWDIAPTLGGRYYFARRDVDTSGPEALSRWSLEIGAVVPHQVQHEFVEVNGNVRLHGAIHRITSQHLAVQYRWPVRRPVRMVPELSLGVSLTQFRDEFDAHTLNLSALESGTKQGSAIGPLVRAGLSVLANDWFALRMELGYEYFPNKVVALNHTIDLGASGIGLYPSLQVSLGYLHPGVEKGVYLPNSMLPAWTIAALQSEKRSPIIAPPEVLLNPNQAAVQGGLSGNILFQYKNRSARKVEILGDFNQWKPEPMYMDQAHVWITVRDLPAGTYHYAFLINGRREIRDPWNTSFDPSSRGGVSTFVVPEVMPK
jgi:hypothetical protein